MSAGRSLSGRRATVMGLGLFGGGVETVRFLHERGGAGHGHRPALGGRAARVPGTTRGTGLRARLSGGTARATFTGADLIVANPAVPPTSPFLERARAAGRTVTSEMNLFLEACPARVVLITGTQGKSSTCTFLATLARSSGRRVHLGGNIGRSLLGSLADMHPEDLAVVEISSYQLESLPRGGRGAALGRGCSRDPERAGRPPGAPRIDRVLPRRQAPHPRAGRARGPRPDASVTMRCWRAGPPPRADASSSTPPRESAPALGERASPAVG